MHLYSLKRIRLALGMRRSTKSSGIDDHNTAMRVLLEKELASGQISSYGRGLSYQHLKSCGIPIARDRMFEILRDLDPEGVQSRSFNLFTSPRGNYTVPGPNFVWSVDGHLKLHMYGIEIYAGIDAYLRYFTSFVMCCDLILIALFQLHSVDICWHICTNWCISITWLS